MSVVYSLLAGAVITAPPQRKEHSVLAEESLAFKNTATPDGTHNSVCAPAAFGSPLLLAGERFSAAAVDFSPLVCHLALSRSPCCPSLLWFLQIVSHFLALTRLRSRPPSGLCCSFPFTLSVSSKSSPTGMLQDLTLILPRGNYSVSDLPRVSPAVWYKLTYLPAQVSAIASRALHRQGKGLRVRVKQHQPGAQ